MKYGQNNNDNIEFWNNHQNVEGEGEESRSERRQRLQRVVLNAEPHLTEKIAAAQAELDKMDAENEAEFWAEWTPATTVARRAEWNAWVKAQGKPGWPTIRKQEKAQGWTLESLKKAVAAHND